MEYAYARNPIAGIGKTLSTSVLVVIETVQPLILPIVALTLLRWAFS